MTHVPFLFGAQYYRAPTPEPACWETDLQRMAALGFNAVKYWVQWRWSHRDADRFVFDDLDRLMDLAAANGLAVTLNTIFDVAPRWLYDRYPYAKQVMNNGHVLEPYTVGHRQIGGHPGPCYNHPGALAARRAFLAAAVDHFAGHPALAMWDVWNEPELAFPQRAPDVERLVCYCDHCRAAFLTWLRARYATLDDLNAVWGRCYERWEEVELPRNPATFTDFVDWREFHTDTMTGEAAWRLAMVRERDPGHVRYLHVVPNTMRVFNVVTCAADDFALAEDCQVFAATMNGGPVMATQVVSAARGKVVYNVESHVNHGCTSLHQRVLELDDLLLDFLPQIGLGIRGFLFWQYRPEVLGFEAPAWGLVNLDGSDRPVTRAAVTFWRTLRPHVEGLLACPAPEARVGIWKSRKNEIFHFAMHRDFGPLAESVEGYQRALYWLSVPTRVVSGAMVAAGDMAGLKLLVMPSPYYLTEAEAAQLDAWVRAGGTLLVEAHLGGYNGTTGRHSRTMPGCGLAEAWGLREVLTTASHHLRLDAAALGGLAGVEGDEGNDGNGIDAVAVTEDVRKALADLGVTGGRYVPLLRLKRDGVAGGAGQPGLLWGATRYAELGGDDLTVEAVFDDAPVAVSKRVGAGTVIYAGTRLGQGAALDPAGLRAFLRHVVARAGIAPVLDARAAPGALVHVDLLRDGQGTPRYLVVVNRDAAARSLHLTWRGMASGLFTGATWTLDDPTPVALPPNSAELLVLGER